MPIKQKRKRRIKKGTSDKKREYRDLEYQLSYYEYKLLIY